MTPFLRASSFVILTCATIAASVVLVAIPGSAPAGAASVVATDGFDRSAGKGWGNATKGGGWVMEGGSSSSVKSSAGTVASVKPGRSFRAQLPKATSRDVRIHSELTAPKSAGIYYAVEARRQADGSAYRGRLRIDSKHSLHVELLRTIRGKEAILAMDVLDITVKAGEVVSVDLEVSGTTPAVLLARVYVGKTAPGWQLRFSDTTSARIQKTGSVGVQGYVTSSSIATSFVTRTFSVIQVVKVATPAKKPVTTAKPAVAIRGAVKVGAANYAVPSGALFVSAAGRDSNPGTRNYPLRSVKRAIDLSRSGQTVVLRAGRYHESVIVPPGKAITIQAYPKEAVWFDGSRAVSSFKKSGAVWTSDKWTAKFDSGPTYTAGQKDRTEAGWQFVNPAHPLAAHPDQVWINGVEQTQVATLRLVKAGTFYVDYSASRLHLGTNPSGKTVEASDLSTAISLRAPGTVLRGFGVRRYANSVHQQGVITSYYPRMTLENIEVRDSATAGVGIYGSDCIVRGVTITGSGQMGLQASYADRLMVDRVSLRNNNDQHFNPAPSAGGFKITTTRGVTFKNSEILRTDGNAFWADESVYNMTVVNNRILDNNRWGMVFELSSTAIVANNLIAGNAHDGIMVQNSDRVQIWNNTIVNNKGRAVSLVQDQRRAEDPRVAGHDRRRPIPDPTMPWITREITLSNNIYTAGTKGFFAAEVYQKNRSASSLKIVSNGNVYNQRAVGTPKLAILWAEAGREPRRFGRISDFVAATGQDKLSNNLLSPTATSSTFAPTAAVLSKRTKVARPLPASIASKTGKQAGTKHLGAWIS